MNETSIIGELLKNGLTIFLVLVAGFLALLQVKSNIISSARIRWIENLRETISKYYKVSMDIVYHYSEFLDSEDKESDKMFNKYEKEFSDFNAISNQIRMSLNPNEYDHLELEKLIYNVEQMLDADSIENTTQEDIGDILNEIVVLSRKIFKTEWDKSKRIFKI